VTDGDDADSYFTDDEWEETKAAVRSFYEPGRYVTILASEYHERAVAGDRNIYYRGDNAPLLRWSDLKGTQPEVLWEALRGRAAFTVPHHPTSNSAGCAPWEHHDPQYQRLVEIYSIWGCAEDVGTPRPNYWVNNYDNSVRRALDRGYRLGIVAAGDSHDGRAGNSRWMRFRCGYPNGLAGVYAPELTREAIYDALWNRRCYGTTGERIILQFTLNGAAMGEELSGPAHRDERRLSVAALGTDQIASVSIVRNGREVYARQVGSDQVAFDWVDREDFSKTARTGYDGNAFVYYRVRVAQVDGALAWSSPIWIL